MTKDQLNAIIAGYQQTLQGLTVTQNAFNNASGAFTPDSEADYNGTFPTISWMQYQVVKYQKQLAAATL